MSRAAKESDSTSTEQPRPTGGLRRSGTNCTSQQTWLIVTIITLIITIIIIKVLLKVTLNVGCCSVILYGIVSKK